MKPSPPRIYTLSVPFPRYPPPFPGIEEKEKKGKERQERQHNGGKQKQNTHKPGKRANSFNDIFFLPSPAGPPFDLPLSNTAAVVVVVVVRLCCSPLLPKASIPPNFLSTCFCGFLPLFFGK